MEPFLLIVASTNIHDKTLIVMYIILKYPLNIKDTEIKFFYFHIIYIETMTNRKHTVIIA